MVSNQDDCLCSDVAFYQHYQEEPRKALKPSARYGVFYMVGVILRQELVSNHLNGK